MRISTNQPDRWVVPASARRPGLSHQFTQDGIYVGSTWVGTARPFEPAPVGCDACRRSGICHCVNSGSRLVCRA